MNSEDPMTLSGSPATRPTELPAVPTQASWKVGLDLGSTTTTYGDVTTPENVPAQASSSSLPTLIAYPKKDSKEPVAETAITIGEAAALRRDQLEVVSPLLVESRRRVVALLDFARALRRAMAHGRDESPWGVISCPVQADAGLQKELRAVGAELFERFLLVEEPYLFALGVLGDPLTERALVVDLGATGTRVHAVGGLGSDPTDEENVSVYLPHGGLAVDEDLKALLLQKYSDLVLTALTVARMKEQLGFVGPAARAAQVKVTLGRAQRVLDITDVVREACESVVPVVKHAVLKALARCPRERVGGLLGRICLAGGGAGLPGLPERIQAELTEEGFDQVVVERAENPRGLLALGALKMALLTPDDEWEIPLFALRPTAVTGQ